MTRIRDLLKDVAVKIVERREDNEAQLENEIRALKTLSKCSGVQRFLVAFEHCGENPHGSHPRRVTVKGTVKANVILPHQALKGRRVPLAIFGSQPSGSKDGPC